MKPRNHGDLNIVAALALACQILVVVSFASEGKIPIDMYNAAKSTYKYVFHEYPAQKLLEKRSIENRIYHKKRDRILGTLNQYIWKYDGEPGISEKDKSEFAEKLNVPVESIIEETRYLNMTPKAPASPWSSVGWYTSKHLCSNSPTVSLEDYERVLKSYKNECGAESK